LKKHRAVRVVGAIVVLALCVAPAHGQSSPPPNDNYLASTIIPQASTTGMQATTYTDTEDTTAATTQPDLFNPDRSGLPFGGGGSESLSCQGAAFGKTIWYDLHPQVDEGVELEATGFATAMVVYQWDLKTAKIVRQVGCQVSEGQGVYVADRRPGNG
jgi:hypothetical protein